MSWIWPTSHSDPSSVWNDEANAYNDDTSDFASSSVPSSSWNGYLEMYVASVLSSKVQLFNAPAHLDVNEIRVDVRRASDSEWQNIYDGALSSSASWAEYQIGEELEIKGTRVRYQNSG